MFRVLTVLFILGCGMKLQQIVDKEKLQKEHENV